MLIKPVLIDTSAWIFALRKEYVPEIKDRVDQLLKENLVVITGIIKLEILTGTKSKSEYQRLKKRLTALDNIGTNENIWDTAFELAFNLRRKGLTIPHTDILIAACALYEDCILIHADNHFDLIAQHVGLQTESYVKVINQQ